MNHRRQLLLYTLASCVGAMSRIDAVEAADYPVRPVKIIVPYAAGGGGDALARTLANQMSMIWHRAVVVEDRPGAGSTLGTMVAAQAPGDGYTLLLTGGTLTLSAAIYSNLPYDVIKDFVPITLVASSPFLLVARAGLGVKTLDELLALARKKPGVLNYGSSGKGTMSNLAGEILKQSAGIDVVHVPFKGSSPGLNALLGEQIDYLFEVPPSAIPFVKAGKVKAIAVTSPTRLPTLPDVPTVAESGIKGFDVQIWFGLLAPRNTPESVVRAVRETAIAALRDEKVTRALAAQGLFKRSSTPAEFAQMIKAELPKWAAVVHRANLERN